MAMLRATALLVVARVAACLQPGQPHMPTRRDTLAAAFLPALAAAPLPMHAAEPLPREVMTTVQVKNGGRDTIDVSRKRFTGEGDPKWTYPVTDLSAAILEQPFPAKYPYSAGDFKRLDEDVDTNFYKQPKLVYHIDEGAVASLTHYYDANIADGSDVLDICSSWVSHYPRTFPSRMKSLVGTGINTLELACNDQLTSFKQADLNVKPVLPFPDKSFDVVTCVVSFDYLTQPREVMKEVRRVLRPGGKVILSQSNRCFFTKAVGVWTADMSDRAHLRVLSTYMHFTDGLGTPKSLDISAKGFGTNDPMYIVEATRV